MSPSATLATESVLPLLAIIGAGISLGAVLALWRRVDRARRRHRELEARFKCVERDLLHARRALAAERGERALRAQGREPSLPITFNAEWGEDTFLFDLFAGRTRGRYIEVGAFDGETLSVTRAFESLGWTGVLIEALPESFELCRARRPGSTVVHAALGRRGASGRTTFRLVPGEARSQMLSFLSTNQEHAELLDRRERPAQSVDVPLSFMDAVLGACCAGGESGGGEAAREFDFAVIDVEGGEMDLLDGFDLSRFPVKVIVIEDLTEGRDLRVCDELLRRGYVPIAPLGRNRVYVRSDQPELVARAFSLLEVLE